MDRFDRLAALYGDMMAAAPPTPRPTGYTGSPDHVRFLAVGNKLFDHIVREFEPNYENLTSEVDEIALLFDCNLDNRTTLNRYSVDYTNANALRDLNPTVIIVMIIKNSISVNKLPFDTIKMPAFNPLAIMFRPYFFGSSTDHTAKIAEAQTARARYLKQFKEPVP